MNVSAAAPRINSYLPPKADRAPDFDLTVLDHSREMYFLPGIDRLAATLASRCEVPLKVRLEAEGQFMEYTLDAKHPEAPVAGSLNGSPFEVTNHPGENGAVEYEAKTTGGTMVGNLYTKPNETAFSAIVENDADRMPVAQRINLDPEAKGSLPVGEIIGNFACARMHQDLVQEGDGLHITGTMGTYTVEARLSPGPNGTLINEGDLGDLHFRQIFTPQG